MSTSLADYKIEIVDDISERDCSDIRALVGAVPQNVKMHVNDFCEYLTHKSKLHACIVTLDGKIVGASLFFIKNRDTKESTISLYNVFSLAPGAGTLAFNAYWNYGCAHSVRWFKFYADLGAYEFYKKFKVRYFGVSKTGLTLSTMGRILHHDPKRNMEMYRFPVQDDYLNKNVKVFMEKDAVGRKKVPKKFRYILDENPFYDYKIETSSLEDYFV